MAKVTVSCNKLSVVHKGSGGKAMATLPDVCKTPFPSPPGPLPLPYPNIAESEQVKNGSVMTKIDGESAALMGSSIETSRGDEAGSLGGVVSGSNKDESFFLKWSNDSFIESRPICRKTDMMIMNKINTISLSGMDQDDVEGEELTDDEETDTLEIKLVNDKGEPVANEEYKVKLLDGSERSGQLDDNGEAVEEDIPVRGYKVVFPNLEEEEYWKKEID